MNVGTGVSGQTVDTAESSWLNEAHAERMNVRVIDGVRGGTIDLTQEHIAALLPTGVRPSR